MGSQKKSEDGGGGDFESACDAAAKLDERHLILAILFVCKWHLKHSIIVISIIVISIIAISIIAIANER